MPVQLNISSPGGERFLLFEEYAVLVVGRGTDADLQFPDDPYFSRKHFRLEIAPPQCKLVDLDSRNGTVVNGQKVSGALLQHGDVITCGQTEIAIQVSGPQYVETRILSPHEQATKLGLAKLSEAAGSLKDIEITPETRPAGMPPALNRIGRYELLRELGRGGMGVVYLARDPHSKAQLAVKVIVPCRTVQQKEVQLFLREASILSKLDHPRIVAAREIGIEAGHFYLAMDYVEHQPFQALAQGMDRAKRIRLACGIASQMLDALEYSHAQGIVHRDIKPSNVLLSNGQGKLAVRIADFGIAKNFRDAGFSGITNDSEVRGTLAYMPPEQIEGSRNVGPPADVYAVGATLYQYLSGELPYHFDKKLDPVVVLLTRDPIPLSQRRPDLPVDLINTVERAMERNPEDRFPTAAAMRESLRKHLRKD